MIDELMSLTDGSLGKIEEMLGDQRSYIENTVANQRVSFLVPMYRALCAPCALLSDHTDHTERCHTCPAVLALTGCITPDFCH